MTHDLQDILARFHRALVREIKSNKPEALTAPFSVAEIYQNLVPYRTHRDEIGVEINGDYEHALLRLLTGEGEFLTIESRAARQEIKEELDSPNPNTSLYRDFAAADVLLNPDRVDEALEGWQLPEELPDQEAGKEAEAAGANEEEMDPAEAVAPAPAQEEHSGDSSLPEEDTVTGAPEEVAEASEETTWTPDEEPRPSLEEVVEASSPLVPEEVGGEAQEEWRDPTAWLEPSIENLRDEYERNREASPLETGEASPLESGEAGPLESGEAFHAAEEVASEGLPFEVSVRRGEDGEMEDSPEEEEDRVEEAAAGAVAVGVPEACAWCREKVPDRSGVNFCPFCGMSVKLVPCPECGEELELNWRFCIACGTEVSS